MTSTTVAASLGIRYLEGGGVNACAFAGFSSDISADSAAIMFLFPLCQELPHCYTDSSVLLLNKRLHIGWLESATLPGSVVHSVTKTIS
jgi:hypothetical protein